MKVKYEDYVALCGFLSKDYPHSMYMPKEWEKISDLKASEIMDGLNVVANDVLSYDRYIRLRRAARHEGEVKHGFQECFDVSQDGWPKLSFYLRKKMIDGLLIETAGSTPKIDPDHENFYPGTWGNW